MMKGEYFKKELEYKVDCWSVLNIDTMKPGVKRGSVEALSWMEGWIYSKDEFPSLIQYIYDAKIYKKLTKTCSEEQLYKLDKYNQEFVLKVALDKFIREMKDMIYKKGKRKRELINEELNRKETVYNTMNELSRELKKEEEREYEIERAGGIEKYRELQEKKRKERKEREKRDKVYYYGIDRIPIRTLIDQPGHEAGWLNGPDGSEEVTYLIKEKIYGCWSAFVKSSIYIEVTGKDKWDLLRSKTLEGLRKKIKEYQIEKRKEINRIENGEPEVNDIEEEIDISNIEKMMGMDDNVEDDLNGDIF